MRGLIGLLCLWLLAGTALPASAQSPVERGRYLVEVVGGCGNCHTPKGPEGDLPGKHLAGGFQAEEAFGDLDHPEHHAGSRDRDRAVDGRRGDPGDPRGPRP